MSARNFRHYKVWQDAVQLSVKVYKITSELPYFEKKGLCDQLQRAVVSISSNIAEGSARPTNNDFAHFLDIALGSSYEVENQLEIAYQVGYITKEIYDKILGDVCLVETQLVALIRSLRKD